MEAAIVPDEGTIALLSMPAVLLFCFPLCVFAVCVFAQHLPKLNFFSMQKCISY